MHQGKVTLILLRGHHPLTGGICTKVGSHSYSCGDTILSQGEPATRWSLKLLLGHCPLPVENAPMYCTVGKVTLILLLGDWHLHTIINFPYNLSYLKFEQIKIYPRFKMKAKDGLFSVLFCFVPQGANDPLCLWCRSARGWR
jgi:hypothetical protein